MTNFEITGFCIIMKGDPFDETEEIMFHINFTEEDHEDCDFDEMDLVQIKTDELSKSFPERKFTFYWMTETSLKDIKQSVKNQINYEIQSR